MKTGMMMMIGTAQNVSTINTIVMPAMTSAFTATIKTLGIAPRPIGTMFLNTFLTMIAAN
jgi:hypothetical protein